MVIAVSEPNEVARWPRVVALPAPRSTRDSERVETLISHSKQRIDTLSTRDSSDTAFPAFFAGPEFLIANHRGPRRGLPRWGGNPARIRVLSEHRERRNPLLFSARCAVRAKSKFTAGSRRDCVKLMGFFLQERLVRA